VELLGRYSSYAYWTKQVRRAKVCPRTVASAPTLRKPVRKLGSNDFGALVAGYEAGATVYELAERFKIHRVTVAEHLHRQQVCLRRRSLSSDQIEEAAQLYLAGWSLARVGGHFKVNGTTVWRELRKRGVAMRAPYERGVGSEADRGATRDYQ
jgi:Helix-turn-helix domain